MVGHRVWTKAPQAAESERRASPRFQLSLEVRYIPTSRRAAHEKGYGRTIDMSSSGLKFSSDGPVLVGQRVEVLIDWPAVLEGNIKLQLVVLGVVVRTKGPEVAIRIQKHQFRTRSAGGAR